MNRPFNSIAMRIHTAAARDVLIERRRQQQEESWTPDHDDRVNDAGDLASAGASYAVAAADSLNPFSQGDGGFDAKNPPVMWPANWLPCWWKPKGARRNLVIAAALILAEIEKIDRAAEKGPSA